VPVYFPTPPNWCLYTTRQHRNTELAFFHQNAELLLCQSLTSRCLISSTLLTRDSHSRCCMTPESSNQRWTVWALAPEKGSWEFCAAAVRSLRPDAPVHCLAEMEPGARVTGYRVTGSAILARSGRVTGQRARTSDPVLSFNMCVYRSVVSTSE